VQLVQAGHARDAIDAAWEQLAAEAQPLGAGRNLAAYVWVLYWLGAGIIGAFTVLSSLGSGSGPGFSLGFGIGWLVAYLFVAYWPTRAFARARPVGAGGMLAVIVGVPLVILLIGGGICLGTIAIIAGGLGLR
jgi:hypothetical protein